MDMIKTIFPYSFGAKDLKALAIKIVVYLVVGAIVGLLCGVIGLIPLLGAIIAWAVGGIVSIYCLAGIVIAVLDYMKVLK